MFRPTKGGKLCIVITRSIFCSNQKTDYLCITGYTHAMYGVMCFPAFVWASDIISSILSIPFYRLILTKWQLFRCWSRIRRWVCTRTWRRSCQSCGGCRQTSWVTPRLGNLPASWRNLSRTYSTCPSAGKTEYKFVGLLKKLRVRCFPLILKLIHICRWKTTRMYMSYILHIRSVVWWTKVYMMLSTFF